MQGSSSRLAPNALAATALALDQHVLSHSPLPLLPPVPCAWCKCAVSSVPPQSAALDSFATLSLGPHGPGMPGQQQDPSAAAAAFPRPAGPGAEELVGPPPPYAAANCKPQYVRPTTQAIPNSQALKARWHLPLGAGGSPLGV